MTGLFAWSSRDWPLLAALGASLLFALIPLCVHRFSWLAARQQVRLFSFASGIGLTYIVLYLLYKLTKAGAPALQAWQPLAPVGTETMLLWLYAALVGAVLWHMHVEGQADPQRAYALRAGGMTLYGALVGAGLELEGEAGVYAFEFYVVAMGLHLALNEHFLQSHHPFDPRDRWIQARAWAPVAGYLLALWAPVEPALYYVLLSWIAGVTIVQVFCLELPRPNGFRSLPFLAGCALYAFLIWFY